MSLERGICSCAELQDFSCYRGWKEACQATRAISTTRRRELSSSFFFPLQGKAPKEIHYILTETLGEHAPLYATVKNWVAQFQRRDFSICDAPRPGRPKTMTLPKIIDQIDELILGDCGISAKSIAEQLGISRERVGSIIREDLNMRKISANVNAASQLSNFWHFFGAIQMISCRDWWQWTKPGYITMTRRQSNNKWSGDIAAHPAPKNSECNNPLEKFSPRFYGIKTTSSSLIIFERTKLSTRSITHLFWCNWRTFWRKNATGRSPRGSCSCTTMSRLTGHLKPRTNWPTWASSVLNAHPILRIWPRRTTTCSMDWKNKWKVAIFRPTRRPLLPRRPG